MRGAVELFDNLNPLLGFGVPVQSAVVQAFSHAVTLQNVQQLQGSKHNNEILRVQNIALSTKKPRLEVKKKKEITRD